MFLYKGAEAEIFTSTYLGKEVVKKRRIPKGYRLPDIDKKLRSYRTKEEAKLIVEARKAGVSVPIIYDVDLEECIITMEYVRGDRIKDIISKLSKDERRDVCIKIGQSIARLHNQGIIHGDITTSNMILLDGRVYFIDFGLGEFNSEIEARGVDLHLLMEAFSSAHSEYRDLFDYVLEGYKSEYRGNFKEIKRKIEDIIRRGRYMR